MSTAIEDENTHAELMDSVYRYQRYIYDLTRKYYLFGRDRLIREMKPAPGQSVLEVGCGTARNLILMARRYPGVHFHGLDASHEMLKTAKQHVERAGLADRITLQHGYAESLRIADFGRTNGFDHVVLSYSLSMIPDWDQGLKAAVAILGDQGRLHVVDFGDLTGLGPVGAAIMRAWLHLFHVEPRTQILRALEHGLPKNQNKSNSLCVLPGRYAFVLNCTAADLATAFG